MDGPRSGVAAARNDLNPRMSTTGTVVGPFALIPFLTQLDVCLIRKEWYEFNALGASLVVLSIIFIVSLRAASREMSIVLRELQTVIAGFLALAVIALCGAMLPDAYLEDGAKYVFYPTADAIVFILGACAAVMCRRDVTWRLAMCVAMGMIVASILWDSLHPGTFSMLTTRAAGFGVNPNIGGAIVVLLLIGLLDWKAAGFTPFAIAAFACSGLGTFLTLSRSALLFWVITGGLYFIRSLIARGTSAWLASAAIGFPIVIFAASAGEWARETFPMLQESHARIEAFLGGASMDHSDDSRVHIAGEYFEMALESPWVGWGTGLNFTVEEGAHNIYLAKWVENGLAALLSILFLIFATFRLGIRNHDMAPMVMAIYVFVQGFFSHNLFEDKTILLMWGLVCGRAALQYAEQQRPQPKFQRQERVVAPRLRARTPLRPVSADPA